MPTGRVNWFNVNKGYGFINNDEGGEVFVHYKDIAEYSTRKLIEDDKVEFEIVDSEKGPKAVKVKLIER